MVLPVLAQWVLGLAAFITAAGVVWKFGRRLYRIDAAMPTLLQIAAEFNPAGGAKTLHQRILDIDIAVLTIKSALLDIKDDTHQVMEKINGTPEGEEPNLTGL